MRKILIRIGVLVAVFFLGIFLFSHFMNIENTDRTSAMAEPTLPVVYVRDGDQLINEMYGYTGQMQANYMRDTLTLLPSDYRLTVDVDTYGRTITKISYEVRSADATRLVENTEVTYLTEKDGYLEAELPLKKLLDQNEEYILQIVLHADNDQNISYYMSWHFVWIFRKRPSIRTGRRSCPPIWNPMLPGTTAALPMWTSIPVIGWWCIMD